MLRGMPNQSPSDKTKAKRQRQLDPPKGNPVRQPAAGGFFRQNELNAGDTKECADGGSCPAADDDRRRFEFSFKKTGEGGKGEEASFARRDGAAEHADNQSA